MRGCPKTFRNRRAFSLAEVMIAIGILGVGLLMVAATFPVGLDQSRIVAEQTIAPLVVEDAFQRLKLLLDEPAGFKRIPNAAAAPTAWLYSFQESLRQLAVQQYLDAGSPTIDITVNGPIQAYLTNGVAAENPAMVGAPIPPTWTGLNELLVAPFDSVVRRGVGVRFYPSIGAKLGSSTWPYNWSLPLRTDAAGQPSSVPPPYTWSALYRVYSVVKAGPPVLVLNYVQFFVFVNRRGEDWPSDWPKPVERADVKGIIGGNEIWLPPAYAGPKTSTRSPTAS
jgi:prepilin-type N-terminal cleavage/methylation domain-containing protein